MDFYCPLVRLAVELDGEHHYLEEGKIYDEERERFLSGKFINTIRFRNEDVLNDIEKVLKTIKENFG